MMKNRIVVLSILLMMPVCLCAAPSSLAASGADRPNFLLIIADDLNWRDLGFTGNQEIHTPNLDRLRSEGMYLRNMIDPATTCSPTRHALYMGLHCIRAGAYPNHTRAYEGTKSVFTYLKDAGYRVGLQAKTHVGPKTSFPFEYISKDADDFDAFAGFVNRDRSQPWLAVFASHDPHAPWTRGPKDLYHPAKLTVPPYLHDNAEMRRELAAYYAEITQLDTQVGALMKVLADGKQADNTLVMFVSEQGSSFPYGGKWLVYDNGIHAAAVVRWPGRVRPGSSSDALMQYSDVTPTFLAVAGIDPTKIDTGCPDARGYRGFDGTSFVDVLLGQSNHHLDYAFSQHTTVGINGYLEPYPMRAVRDLRYKYIRNLTPENTYSIAGIHKGEPLNSWKQDARHDAQLAARIQWLYKRPAEELYDVQTDPYEMKNLAASPAYASTKLRLSRQLDAWMAQQGDKGLETELLAPTRQGKAANGPSPNAVAGKRGANKETSQKPNLLFIMTDQQRYDALSIAGNTVLQTPNLDRLARQGAYFRHAYTPCAVCAPARASILTGHTVEHTGSNTNARSYYVDRELLTMPTFDEILTGQGYHCEYYGKWHTLSCLADVYKNPVKAARNGKSIFGPGGQRYIYLDYLQGHVTKQETQSGELTDKFTGMLYRTDPLDKHYGMTDAELKAKKLKFPQCDAHGELLMPKEFTLTAFQAKQTIAAIKRLKDRPFSITCSFHFPHAPMLPPEPYYSLYPAKDMVPPVSISDPMKNSPYRTANGRLGNPEYADPEKIKYMISSYYGLVKEIDDWVGEILNTLEEQGLADNTLVIFTSDHGEMLGAHGMREKNVFYEESAHIPLIMRFPGEVKRNTTVTGYVSNVDLFATILDYMKAGVHKSDGRSLRDLIEGTDSEHGQYVVTEWDYRGDTESNYMIVKGGWKLIIPYSKESRVINAMYDLQTDPYEMNNLLGRNPDRHHHAEKAEELRACLLEWLKKHRSKHIQGVKARDLM